jgi:hypothetical protein
MLYRFIAAGRNVFSLVRRVFKLVTGLIHRQGCYYRGDIVRINPLLKVHGVYWGPYPLQIFKGHGCIYAAEGKIPIVGLL